MILCEVSKTVQTQPSKHTSVDPSIVSTESPAIEFNQPTKLSGIHGRTFRASAIRRGKTLAGDGLLFDRVICAIGLNG